MVSFTKYICLRCETKIFGTAYELCMRVLQLHKSSRLALNDVSLRAFETMIINGANMQDSLLLKLRLCLNCLKEVQIKGAVSYYTHMLLRITNLKALGQRFQV